MRKYEGMAEKSHTNKLHTRACTHTQTNYTHTCTHKQTNTCAHMYTRTHASVSGWRASTEVGVVYKYSSEVL